MDNGNILEIEHTEAGYTVTAPDVIDGNENMQVDDNEAVLEKAPQKTLRKTPLKQTGFSDTILLALLTGMFIGLVILNIYIRII